MIEFISHEFCNEDPYIKEIVYLSIDPKARIAYVRKTMKTGGMFWAPISCAINVNGAKKYFDSIEWDSNFLKKDILAFLEARSWESKAALHLNATDSQVYIMTKPLKDSFEISPPTQMSFLDTCPF